MFQQATLTGDGSMSREQVRGVVGVGWGGSALTTAPQRGQAPAVSLSLDSFRRRTLTVRVAHLSPSFGVTIDLSLTALTQAPRVLSHPPSKSPPPPSPS